MHSLLEFRVQEHELLVVEPKHLLLLWKCSFQKASKVPRDTRGSALLTQTVSAGVAA